MVRVRLAFLSALGVLLCGHLAAQPRLGVNEDVVINEVYYLGGINEDWIELKNTGATTIDVSTWWLCARFEYALVANLTILAGDLVLGPGEIVVVQVDGTNPEFDDLNNTSSDVGLYLTDAFADPNAMIDFVQYGTEELVGRSEVARDKGVWLETDPGPPPLFDFVPTAVGTQTAAYCGFNSGGTTLLTLSRDFNNGDPSQGVENLACLIFSDGFESGDTGAWSSVIP